MTCKLEITAYPSIILADCQVSALFVRGGGGKNLKKENPESGRKFVTSRPVRQALLRLVCFLLKQYRGIAIENQRVKGGGLIYLRASH